MMQQKVGRNELCPCGSAKKYKHCHGRFASAERSDRSIMDLAELPASGRNIVIDWQVSSYVGWGVYGLNLALEFAVREHEFTSTCRVNDRDIVIDALRLHKLWPFIA